MKQPILIADHFMNKTFIRLFYPLDIKDGEKVEINGKEYFVEVAFLIGDKQITTYSYYVDGKVGKGDLVVSK